MTNAPGDATDLFPGNGESAALMRAIDWASTPLGRPETWPRSLRTIVPIMLASRFAMRVLWGPEFIFLYNDAYRPILGASKHPSAMASRTSESFREVWDVVGPLFHRVYAGEAVALEDTLLSLDRNGYLEECYFTLSYSPMVDDGGAIGGVLGVVHETTEHVIAKRRLATLRDLAAGTSPVGSLDAALARTAAVLARNPADVPFALLYVLEPDGERLRLAGQAGLERHPSVAPARVELAGASGAGWPFVRAADEAAHLVVADLHARFGDLVSGAYPEPVHTALIVPMRRLGTQQLYGFFVAGVSPRRALGTTYREFFELASDQIGKAGSETLDRHDRDRLVASERVARAEAERSNHAKDEFLAIVSHELRNPLSAMLGWTRLLRSGALTPEKNARALETIERNAVNQAQLVEDLLDVSRIISGKLRLDVRLVSFVDVVRAAIDSARPAMDAKQLKLKVVLDSEALALMGDATRLQQIVWNLLSNATKFTPKGGSIQIILKRVDSLLELSVADTGKGIPSGFLPHVFDRFLQADPTTTRTQGGLGLGLSIAKNLVELHGGTISAHSEGEGKGCTFVVQLPVAPLRESPAPAARMTAGGEDAALPRWTSPPELEGLRILVVDDEPDGRELVGEVLEQCGAIVTSAGSVREALAAFDAARPDVILSDIGMPGEDGFSLIRQVRARQPDAGGHTPAASLSAYAAAEDRRRALLAGFNMHVPKPVEPAELLAVVASLGRMAFALR